jgi:hypothetical protein
MDDASRQYPPIPCRACARQNPDNRARAIFGPGTASAWSAEEPLCGEHHSAAMRGKPEEPLRRPPGGRYP